MNWIRLWRLYVSGWSKITGNQPKYKCDTNRGRQPNREIKERDKESPAKTLSSHSDLRTSETASSVKQEQRLHIAGQ